MMQVESRSRVMVIQHTSARGTGRWNLGHWDDDHIPPLKRVPGGLPPTFGALKHPCMVECSNSWSCTVQVDEERRKGGKEEDDGISC
jgi:hypothetical protein